MDSDYVVKTISAHRVVGRTATISVDELAAQIEPMFDAVGGALTEAGASLQTPIATYAMTGAGMDVVVGYVSSASPPAGTDVFDLPAALAVCGVHLGPMAGIHQAWQLLHGWAIENDYRFAGPSREIYLKAESDDQSDWVTELQQPIVAD